MGSVYGNSPLPSELSPMQQYTAHAVTSSTSPANHIAFAHAALFSPALSTLEEALCHDCVPEFAGLNFADTAEAPATIQCHHQRTLGPDMQELAIHKPRPATTPPLKQAPDDKTSTSTSINCTHFCYAAMMEPTSQHTWT